MINNEELRLRRALEGWNQTKLAKELEITQEHLSRVEAGKEPISKKLEKRYIKKFGKKLLVDILIPNLRFYLREAGMHDASINSVFFLAQWSAIDDYKKRKRVHQKRVHSPLSRKRVVSKPGKLAVSTEQVSVRARTEDGLLLKYPKKGGEK